MNPWFVGRVLWPLHERLRGRVTVRLLRELLAGERLSREEIERRQVEALRRVLDHAARTTPYYRQEFERCRVGAADIRRLADLERVPLLTKAQVRARGRDLVDPSALHRLSPHATSGSTGEPLAFVIDRRRTAADNAARARFRLWWGVRPGEREAVIWGSAADLRQQRPVRRFLDRLMNQRTLPAGELGDAALAEMVDALARFRPAVLFGYASALGRLAEFLAGPEEDRCSGKAPLAGLRDSVRLVVATAEPLLPHYRRALREGFDCGVATEYGARECGVLAGECPEGRLHVAAEQALIEVVDPDDGRVLDPGETGELAVTLLREYGMPMIRYRVGDVGSLASEPCPCGRTLPVLAGVEGRRRDLLRLPGGRIVHPSVFSRHLAEVRGLSRYRVVQTSSDRFVIRVLLGARTSSSKAGVSMPHDLLQALDAIRAELGPGIDLAVEFTDALDADASGKFRWVVGLEEKAISHDQETEERGLMAPC